MKSRSAFLLSSLLLSGALGSCASSPPTLVGEPGEAPMTPGVVVIGAAHDGSVAVLDAAVPSFDAGSTSEPVASGDVLPKPSDAATPAPVDGAAAQIAHEDAGPTEGGGAIEMGQAPADAGTVPPPTQEDAGAPPTVVDAGLPPVVVVDAGPPQVVDAGRVGCLPGLYKGRFEGEISALLGLVRIDVAGDITIEVDLVGAPADRLQIRNGLLQGTDTSEQRNPLFARISGVLNCATKKLENGLITDGTYNRVDPIWGGPPTTTTFTGTVTADYSDNPPSAAGTWQVQNDLGTRTSVGTWNAALQ